MWVSFDLTMATTINKRSLQKQARCDGVVAAAEALIRERGDISFSMLDLAEAAGLSPATPYNLFGSRNAILYALLNESADRIFAAAKPVAGSGPVARAIEAAEALARVLTSDPIFYRPLYAYLMGVLDARWRPAFIKRSRDYWSAPFSQIDQTAHLPYDKEVLGDLMVVQALGCVEMWVHREIDDASLAIELRRSCAAILQSFATGPERDTLAGFVGAPRTIRFTVPEEADVALSDQPSAPAKKRRASE